MPLISPVHYNDELAAAIAIIYNGKDMLSVSVVPLGPDYAPTAQFPIFDTKIKPQRTDETLESFMSGEGLRKENRLQIMNGLDYDVAGDLFIDWFSRLGLSRGKKIVPIAYRWWKIRPYLERWLGEENFAFCFSKIIRDVHAVKSFVNDVDDMRSDRVSFPNDGLTAMTRRMKLEEGPSYDSLNRARQTADCYANVLKKIAYGT